MNYFPGVNKRKLSTKERKKSYAEVSGICSESKSSIGGTVEEEEEIPVSFAAMS